VQSKGTEKILYGLDDVTESDEIIFVEGEMDKLALFEAGFTNAVSVPDGAPIKAAEGDVPSPEQDVKYGYLWNCRDVIDRVIRVVLASDNDEPGRALSEELSRRMGRERCYRVRWPTTCHDSLLDSGEDGEPAVEGGEEGEDLSTDSEASPWFRKDANEVLMKDGAATLGRYVEAAEEYPIRGLFRLSDFWGEVYDYYMLRLGDEGGVSTGWDVLDDYYRVRRLA
jgi:twinkle protein